MGLELFSDSLLNLGECCHRHALGLGIGMKELGDLGDVGFELLVLLAVHQAALIKGHLHYHFSTDKE